MKFEFIGLFILAFTGVNISAQNSILIHERLGIPRIEEPVTLGIPFAKGELLDIRSLEILENENPIDAEVDVMSRWSDGSVRWAKAHLQVNAGANSTHSPYSYAIGNAEETEGSILVNETLDDIIVNTGVLEFSINKNNFNLFNTVDLDLNRDGTYQNDERVVEQGASVGASVKFNNQTYTSNFGAPDIITIERQGPLSAVIYLSGVHAASNGTYLKYETRIYAYSGKPYVRVSHNYSSHTFITGAVQGLTDPSLQVPIDDYALQLQLNLAGTKTVRFGGENGIVHSEQLNPGGNVSLTQADKVAFADPFHYGVSKNGVTTSQGKRAEGWAIASGNRFAVGVGNEYFWERMPGSIDFYDNGALSIHPIMEKSLHVSMGAADEYIFWFMDAADIEKNQVSMRALTRGRLIAKVEKGNIESSNAFYKLNDCYETEWPNMKAYIDLVSASHISTRDELDLYGDLNFGDVPRSFFETDADDNKYNVWGNNYYDCSLTAARLFALHDDIQFFDILEPMTRHWMETDCWNASSGNPYHGYVPSYSFGHRENPNFNHHYGEGVWYYYYLTGNERARDIGIRAATTIDEEQFWGNEFSTLRGAALRGAACLEAYKATGDINFLNRTRNLIDIIMDTQNQYGMIGNIFQSVNTGRAEIGGSQTFMMGLFADLVWKYLQEEPDENLKDNLVLLADFVNSYARIPNETENYYNFWGSTEQLGIPQPEFEGSLDDYVYWNSKGLIAGLYAYAYDLTQEEKYRGYTKSLLDHMWGTGYAESFGDEFWGKASSQAMKNALHAASIVCAVDDMTTAISHLELKQEGIEIFPNPTDQYFNISGNLSNYNIDILNIFGTVVQTINSESRLQNIDISKLGEGMYFIRAVNRSNDKLHVELVVKQ